MEELKEKIWNSLIKLYGAGLEDFRNNANMPSVRAGVVASEILTLFQTHLEEQLEGLKVIGGEIISEEIQKKTKKWSICNPAFIEDITHIAVQAQLEYVKKQLRDIWREK